VGHLYEQYIDLVTKIADASLLVLLVSLQNVEAQEAGAATVDGSGRITVPLTGAGAMRSNDSLAISPRRVELGLVEIGMATSQTFTIQNTSAQSVAIENAELFGKSAHEIATNLNGFFTLAANETRTFNVTFTPLTPGDKAAGLRLSIGGATNPYVVLFTGDSRYPLTSQLKTSTAEISFGQNQTNSNAVSSFVLTNEGDEGAPSINVSAIQKSGTNQNDFNVNFAATTLLPGEELSVQVQMLTGNVGPKNAVLEVFHDGNNGALEIELEGNVVTANSVPINFDQSQLNANQLITGGTSLQFGPDDRLYVSEMDGPIHVFNVTRSGKNNYNATLFETINLIKNVQNHNDDGSLNFANKRLLTGIYVAGTAAQPIIYAASSDPRIGAGPVGLGLDGEPKESNDTNLDTNSGILHRLTRNADGWSKLDLVRGLPRSEENHIANGLVLVDNKIYINMGGHTNQGLPSRNFAELPEFALSAATLVIDLAMIGNSTYDLPTLNAPNNSSDPFGGQDGLNQAILEQNGPVKIFATGLRNAYDIVYTESGRFYVWDNGPNTGWGGTPNNTCLNTIDNGGTKYHDGLHLISQGYYAGHPNPTRGNKANTFGGQSPIQGPANPEECNFLIPNQTDGSLTTHNESTNGLAEYTASNFAGSMKGNLLGMAHFNKLYNVGLNASGTQVTSKTVITLEVGQRPLDVTAQGDDDVFPGTIWTLDNILKTITVLEPSDY